MFSRCLKGINYGINNKIREAINMRRVAEILYIVESEREAFLNGALNLDEETSKVLWLCGVRKQQYFALNDLIFMTFEYKGNDFNEDMNKMAAYLDTKGLLVRKRRKDVPVEERTTTSWWAPVKKLGSLLDSKPDFGDDEALALSYSEMLGGCVTSSNNANISYDEDDWTECVQIF